MVAVLQPDKPSQSRRSQRLSQSRFQGLNRPSPYPAHVRRDISQRQSSVAAQAQSRPTGLASRPAVVHPLPQARPLPVWLKLLITAQRSASAATMVAIAAGLLTYGWTVLTQQRWGHEYQRWDKLQKQEQQLLAANEILKSQIAKQAETSHMGLVLPNPDSLIFLAPAPPRLPASPNSDLPPAQPIPARPLGY